MSDLLGIGASAVRAYGRALGTVGDNVANANTAGYVRRQAQLREVPPAGADPLTRAQIGPMGVEAPGVTRSSDPWLVEDARRSLTEAGTSAAQLPWLDRVERALDDGGQGVGRALTALFNSADALSADPTSSIVRGQFIGAAGNVAATFARTDNALAAAASDVAGAIADKVTRFNNDLQALQRVNDGLRRAREGSTNQAALLDERDRLLDGLATMLPVGIELERTGAARVLGPDGAVLLAGAERNPLGFVGGAVTGTVASGGELGGLLGAATTIAERQTQLADLAQSVAAQLNAQHIAGRTPDGRAGGVLFEGQGAQLTLAAIGAADVAAADAGSSNGNALAFADLRGGDGVERRWDSLVAGHGLQVANTRAFDQAAGTRREGALAARDDLSAVDLDREAADMLRLQQAYGAAAKILQAARETMQSILEVV